MDSVPMISGKHTYEQDLKTSNPNYSPNTSYGRNCQRCVSTYEARRRGYNVTAKPAPKGYDALSYVHPVENGVFSPYSGANPKDVSANSGTQAELNIDSLMEAWGEGARAIICIQWKDQFGGGHAFIAERVNGKTRYIDPQTGNTNAKGYFELAKGKGVWCGRIDNLPFTPRIHECCSVIKE